MRMVVGGPTLAIMNPAKLSHVAFAYAITAEEALENPRRRSLISRIRRHPGATFRELLRRTEIPSGAARHHLEILKRCSLIDEKRFHQTSRFYLPGSASDQHWRAIAVLREEPLAELHELVDAEPGLRQVDIIDRARDDLGWSRSSTQHRLQRMEDEGLVRSVRMGRIRRYFTTGEGDPALDALRATQAADAPAVNQPEADLSRAFSA